MTTEPELVLPARIVGPSLTAAGLAAWILAHADRHHEAERTGVLQDLVDAALSHGAADAPVPRPVVAEAVDLWEGAATLADAWAADAASEKEAAEWRRHAERLRIRARSLRELLGRRG